MMLAYSKIAFRIGNIPVAWYAICILIGVILAVILGVREVKKMGMTANDIYDGLLFILPAAIIGARLMFVLGDLSTNGSYYNWNILKVLGFVYEGNNITGFRLEGLAIQGGVIVAAIGMVIYCRVKKLNFWKIADIVAPGFLIGQICGRWGNFFNQEVYGAAVDNLNWLPSFISNQMYINGSYRQPLFLYEGIWNLVFLIFFLIIRRKKVLKIGDMICIYLMAYGVGRAWMEPLRDPAYILEGVFGSMQSVLISILFVIAGATIMIAKYWKFDLPYYYDITQEKVEPSKTWTKIKGFFKHDKEETKDDNKDDTV